MTKTIIGSIVQGVSLAAALLALWLAYSKWIGLAESETLVAVIALSAVAGMLLIAVLVQQVGILVYARRARFAEALDEVREAVSATTSTDSATATVEACEQVLRQIVEQTATAFSLVTGTRVNACLKSSYTDDGDTNPRPYVKDVCRDAKSHDRHGTDRAATRHWADMNTDFRYLMENADSPKGDYFLARNLPQRVYYENTSYAVYGDPDRSSLPILGYLLRDRRWPLPYKSTLVVPIKHVVDDGGNNAHTVVEGYLCVDSKSRWAFSARHHVPLLATMAEMTRPFLTRLSALETQAATGGAGVN